MFPEPGDTGFDGRRPIRRDGIAALNDRMAEGTLFDGAGNDGESYADTFGQRDWIRIQITGGGTNALYNWIEVYELGQGGPMPPAPWGRSGTGDLYEVNANLNVPVGSYHWAWHNEADPAGEGNATGWQFSFPPGIYPFWAKATAQDSTTQAIAWTQVTPAASGTMITTPGGQTGTTTQNQAYTADKDVLVQIPMYGLLWPGFLISGPPANQTYIFEGRPSWSLVGLTTSNIGAAIGLTPGSGPVAVYTLSGGVLVPSLDASSAAETIGTAYSSIPYVIPVNTVVEVVFEPFSSTYWIIPPAPTVGSCGCTGLTLCVQLVTAVTCASTSVTYTTQVYCWNNGLLLSSDGVTPFTGSITFYQSYICSLSTNATATQITLTFANGLLTSPSPASIISSGGVTGLWSLTACTGGTPGVVEVTLQFAMDGSLTTVTGGAPPPAAGTTTLTGCTVCCPNGMGCATDCSLCSGGMPNQWQFTLSGFGVSAFNGTFTITKQSGCNYLDLSTGIWTLSNDGTNWNLVGTVGTTSVTFSLVNSAFQCECPNTLTTPPPNGPCVNCNPTYGTPQQWQVALTGTTQGYGDPGNTNVLTLVVWDFANAQKGCAWKSYSLTAYGLSTTPLVTFVNRNLIEVTFGIISLGVGYLLVLGVTYTNLAGSGGSAYTYISSSLPDCCASYTLTFDRQYSYNPIPTLPSTFTITPICVGGSTNPTSVTITPLDCIGTCNPPPGCCPGPIAQTLFMNILDGVPGTPGPCSGSFTLTWDGTSKYIVGQTVGTCTMGTIYLQCLSMVWTLNWNGTAYAPQSSGPCVYLCYLVADSTCGCTNPVYVEISDTQGYSLTTAPGTTQACIPQSTAPYPQAGCPGLPLVLTATITLVSGVTCPLVGVFTLTWSLNPGPGYASAYGNVPGWLSPPGPVQVLVQALGPGSYTLAVFCNGFLIATNTSSGVPCNVPFLYLAPAFSEGTFIGNTCCDPSGAAVFDVVVMQ